MKDNILIKIKKALNRFISNLFNNKKDISNEEVFLHQWKLVLKDNASIFNGLYNGLQKIADGTAKKPKSVIAEWWTRTRYKWENQPITEISRKYMENADDDKCVNIARLLLKAAEYSEIIKETNKKIILNELTVTAYIEWNSNEIFSGDTVRILTPAWYQNNKVIEQGYCELLK